MCSRYCILQMSTSTEEAFKEVAARAAPWALLTTYGLLAVIILVRELDRSYASAGTLQ